MYLLYSVADAASLLRRSCRRTSCTRRSATRSTSAASRQRLGYLPVSFNVDGEESIWIHAVSVGEVLTARALVADLKARYPRLRLFLSTTTMAGQQLARRSLPRRRRGLLLPVRLDVHRPAHAATSCKPRLFVMMETEIWPNLLRECRARGVKTVIVNGRISSRSYPRYRLIRPFFRRVLADVDRFCVQSEESARRLIDARRRPGARHGHRQPEVRFARAAAPIAARRGRASACCASSACRRSRPVLVAGSTMKGEEAAVLRAFRARQRRRRPARCSILAPRHPERFAEVERLAARGRSRRPCAASELPIDAEPRADVVVLDTIGELAQLYQIATAVFVGGSLVDRPAATTSSSRRCFGKPIVFGPHMQNFAEIAEAFLANGAAVQVQTERELERGAAGADDRSGAPRAARRRGARAGRGQPRRQGQDARRASPSCCRRDGPRAPSCGRSAWSIERCSARSYGRVGACCAGAWYARRPHARAPPRAAGHQRRQPRRRRQRQDAGRRGASRACCSRRASGRRSSAAATRARDAGGRRRRRQRRRARARPVERSGDEPLMLARALPGVPCSSSPDRYLAGRLAERRFGAPSTCSTMGFSICSWRATSTCCWCRRRDLDERVLPAGRLRERARRRARRRCAARVRAPSDDAARRLERAGRRDGVHASTRRSEPLRPLGEGEAPVPAGARVVAVARHRAARALLRGAARAGLECRRRAAVFRDHHWFTPTRSRRRSTTPRRRRAPGSW